MNEEEQELKPTEIIFFLGAGASVPADVPDTRKFIYGQGGFLEHISSSGTENEKRVLGILVEKLEGRLSKERVDLEKVLLVPTKKNK